MARKRKEVKQKVMDPITEELYHLLHGSKEDGEKDSELKGETTVDVVTAEYKVLELEEVLNDAVPEAILDVSKLPPLDVVEVECPPVEVKETVVVKQMYSDTSLKKLFDLIEEFCK